MATKNTKTASAKTASAKTKTATAKPARKRATKTEPKTEPVKNVAAAIEPVTTDERASWIDEYRRAAKTAVERGDTTVFAPYVRDGSGIGNKHRVYVKWCRYIAETGVFPSRAKLASIAIDADAIGVKPTTVASWVSHWTRHPAMRRGGAANGVPREMRVHRIDPQWHGHVPGSPLSDDVRTAMKTAIAEYDASHAKRAHDAASA